MSLRDSTLLGINDAQVLHDLEIAVVGLRDVHVHAHDTSNPFRMR
jgi:hypothetical protein